MPDEIAAFYEMWLPLKGIPSPRDCLRRSRSSHRKLALRSPSDSLAMSRQRQDWTTAANRLRLGASGFDLLGEDEHGDPSACVRGA